MANRQSEGVELVDSETVRLLSAAVMFAALTAVLAQFSIDLPGGVPFSFQPFGIFFAALLLGPAWGGFSVLLYVLVGLAGAPVFSNAGAGVGYVLGPTGGFLLGFLFAAIVIGAITHRSVTPKPIAELSTLLTTVALLIGAVVIYAVGIPWLASVNEWTLTRATTFMAPFAAGDLIKIGITVGIIAGGNEWLAARQ